MALRKMLRVGVSIRRLKRPGSTDWLRWLYVGVSLIVFTLAGPAVAFGQSDFARQQERDRMVERFLRHPDRGVPVRDTAVMRAMRTVPRHRFVPPDHRSRAYANTPLPIGHGQTISQPYIVGMMTQLLELEAGDTVLEVGTGSGYHAAVLSEIASRVYTLEIIPELASQARRRFHSMDYDNVVSKQGDGYYGWAEHAPFDAIVVTAAPSHIPPPLLEQLEPGGRMIIPVGPPYRVQQLMLVEKQPDGTVKKRGIMSVRFVPFVRQPS